MACALILQASYLGDQYYPHDRLVGLSAVGGRGRSPVLGFVPQPQPIGDVASRPKASWRSLYQADRRTVRASVGLLTMRQSLDAREYVLPSAPW